MKDKIIRLLKAVGIVLLPFSVTFLFAYGFIRYTKIAYIVTIVLIVIFFVWRIYKDADFL